MFSTDPHYTKFILHYSSSIVVPQRLSVNFLFLCQDQSVSVQPHIYAEELMGLALHWNGKDWNLKHTGNALDLGHIFPDLIIGTICQEVDHFFRNLLT